MMQIEAVKTARHRRAFHSIPHLLYNNTPAYTHALHLDIERVFSPKKNPAFAHGDAMRFVLKRNQKPIGRIGVFYNSQNERLFPDDPPAGGMGFFECIDDTQAAKQLFDAAREWLRPHGYDSMLGPINFGERDSWWGLLIKGFDLPPSYGMYYHLPYYTRLFEDNGFKPMFEQYSYYLPAQNTDLVTSAFERGKRILNNSDYRVVCGKRYPLQQLAHEITLIYNAAWKNFFHLRSALEIQDVYQKLHRMRHFIDPSLICMAYYKQTPIGICLAMPEINKMLKPFAGRMNLFNYLRLRSMPFPNLALGIMFGVVPRFQGVGVMDALIARIFEHNVYIKRKYTACEFNWIGSFNKPVMRFLKDYGGNPYKTFVTYRAKV